MGPHNLNEPEMALKTGVVVALALSALFSVGAAAAPPAQPHPYMRSVVYGALDGIVTTFSVVASGDAAAVDPGVVLVLGFGNLVADGLSMGVGDYASRMADAGGGSGQCRVGEGDMVR